MKTKSSVPNPGYTKTVALLFELGYRCNDQFKRKALEGSYQGMNLPEEFFELFTGPRGCVIVQKWKDGNGANVYCDWTVGHTFPEMRANLSTSSEHLHVRGHNEVANETPSADRS